MTGGGSLSAIGHLLAGIDGSPDSLVALRWAAGFASATGRRLDLAYAWQHGHRLDHAFDRSHGELDVLEVDIEATLRRLADAELGTTSAATSCKAIQGPAAEALAAAATRDGAELLVVGASGAGGARRLLLGSVSQDLTSCPAHAVCIVPPPDAGVRTDFTRPIVVGTDGSDDAARALRWAGAAARRAGVEVVVVHAFHCPVPDPSPRELASLAAEARARVEQEWCAPLRALDVAHRTVFEQASAGELIATVADAEAPMCVVAGSRGLGGISSRLLGSVTHELVRHVAWPTVVIPSARDRAIWPPD